MTQETPKHQDSALLRNQQKERLQLAGLTLILPILVFIIMTATLAVIFLLAAISIHYLTFIGSFIPTIGHYAPGSTGLVLHIGLVGVLWVFWPSLKLAGRRLKPGQPPPANGQ